MIKVTFRYREIRPSRLGMWEHLQYPTRITPPVWKSDTNFDTFEARKYSWFFIFILFLCQWNTGRDGHFATECCGTSLLGDGNGRILLSSQSTLAYPP